MRARYYDPSMGRFISQDPGFNNHNWFVYSSNNPINRTDATGRVDLNLMQQGLDLMGGGAKMMLGSLPFFGRAEIDDLKAAMTDDSPEGVAMQKEYAREETVEAAAGKSALQEGFEMWNTGFALFFQGIMNDGPGPF